MKIIDLDFYNKKTVRSKSQSKNMNNKLKKSISLNEELKYCNINSDENINDNNIVNEDQIDYKNKYLLGHLGISSAVKFCITGAASFGILLFFSI